MRTKSNFQIELFVADLNDDPRKMDNEHSASGSFNTLAIPETDELKEFDENNDLDTIEHDNPGENSCLYLCEICGKDFAGPVTLKIHERVHINDNIIPNDHLQTIPQDLQDDPKDLQDDPQDLQDDPQKVHDDPLDLQDDPVDFGNLFSLTRLLILQPKLRNDLFDIGLR